VRARQPIVEQPASLACKNYLGSEAEVSAYLARLKDELMAAIHAGQRVE
jgi:hypothetical protein